MDLLRNALDAVRERLNAHLQHIEPRPDAWVVLTSLVNHEGARNDAARDKIVMSVYGLSQETFLSQQPSAADPRSGPPLHLDVHLMFLANFADRNYPDGLAALSRVIAFFQETPVFTRQAETGLAAGIERITLDFETLGPAEVSAIMRMMGVAYLPSVFYRLRMLSYGAAEAS